MKKGKMITVKVNKGGIGKTTISTWLAHGLAELGYKTLLLTSDSQNNILDITFKEEQKPLYNSGLKNWVTKGNGDIINIRKNLNFIPLENSIFSHNFLKKLPLFLEKLKEDYDFIINDSIPTIKLDKEFVNSSDKLIIPAFCDRSTVEGILNVIDEAGIDKIFAILVNKFENTETQKKYYKQLKEVLDNTNIIFPNPIPNKSQISKLIDQGKTIWESKSQQVQDIQDSLTTILYELIHGGK